MAQTTNAFDDPAVAFFLALLAFGFLLQRDFPLAVITFLVLVEWLQSHGGVQLGGEVAVEGAHCF
ncbi:MAG: hypothetical protein AABW54_02600 [Candidatus Micrarchaeota archaeon]